MSYPASSTVNHSAKFTSCQNCIKKADCPVADCSAMQDRHSGGNQILSKQVQSGQTVFEAGQKFEGIHFIKSGFFKSYNIDPNGVLQVTGFYFPGDFFGTDGIASGFYSDTVEALDTGSICKVSLHTLLTQINPNQLTPNRENPGILSVVKVFSQIISHDRLLISSLGKMCAQRRFATFLLHVSSKMHGSGYFSDDFTLPMSRTDICNYLCLAIETISRLFTQFQVMGIIDIDKRKLKILDMKLLQDLASDKQEEQVFRPQQLATLRPNPATKCQHLKNVESRV